MVDDGSTDNSGRICDEYKKKDHIIRVIHKSNGGPSLARDTAIDIACGKYIGFIDSDDSIHPRMYEILYDLIQKYKYDISICNYKYTYNIVNKDYKSIESIEVIEMDNIQALNKLYDKDIGVRLVVSWNKLYNSNLFSNLRYEEARVHEDEFIVHKLLYKCKSIVYTNSELYYYLQREGSIMLKRSYKNKVDRLLADSDRMKFFYRVGLLNMTNRVLEIYEYKFFELYREINENCRYEVLKVLKKDFICNLSIIFRLKGISIKTKISWLILVFSPKIYNLYFNEM